MDPRIAEPYLTGFATSMDLVFLVAACVIVVGFVLIWFLRETPLRTQSGIQARGAEEAAAAAAIAPGTTAAAVTSTTDSAAATEPAAPVPAATDTFALHGRVLDTDGGAIEPDDGVTVSLHGLDGVALDRADVGAERFALHAPGPGTYVLIASSRRLRPFAELVTLEEPATRRDLTLARPTVLHGGVVGPDDEPVDGATVTVTDPSGGVRGVGHTGVDGTWELPTVEPGAYTVTVLAAGRTPVAERVEVGPRGVRHDVRLPAARYALDGLVRGADGHGVPESLVVLVGRDGAVVASSVTGADGRFRFDDLPAGRHMLTASGFAPVSREVELRASRDVELTVEPPRAGPARPAETENASTGSTAAVPAVP